MTMYMLHYHIEYGMGVAVCSPKRRPTTNDTFLQGCKLEGTESIDRRRELSGTGGWER